jgi:hypothetical protein
MVDWASLRQVVSTELNKNLAGAEDWKAITYRQKAEETYDTSTGTITPGADVDYSLNALVYTFGFTKTMAGDRQTDDITPIAVDRKCLFAAVDLPIVPKIGDQVIIDGDVWRVIGMNKDPGIMHRNLHIRPLIHT